MNEKKTHAASYLIAWLKVTVCDVAASWKMHSEHAVLAEQIALVELVAEEIPCLARYFRDAVDDVAGGVSGATHETLREGGHSDGHQDRGEDCSEWEMHRS